MKIILLFLSLLWTGSELMAVEKCDLDIPIEKTQSRKDGNIVVNLYSLPCSNRSRSGEVEPFTRYEWAVNQRRMSYELP